MTSQKYNRSVWWLVVLLLTGSPVHDESMGDDHLLQVVLVVSGDAEEVQLVALLIIGDLETRREPRLQLALTGLITVRWNTGASQPPVYPPARTWHALKTLIGVKQASRTRAQPHPDKCTSYQWTPNKHTAAGATPHSPHLQIRSHVSSARPSLFSRSEGSEESCSGPERGRSEKQGAERREEGLLTSSGTSFSPPHPLLLLLPLLLHMRRSSTGV